MTLHLLAWTWLGVTWTVLSVVVVIVSLLLIGVILIQDSKDAGLGGAFGGAGGGGALLGARMQKDLARVTSVLGVIFALCIVVMGLISNYESRASYAGTSSTTGAELAPIETSPPASGSGLPDILGNLETSGAGGPGLTPPSGGNSPTPATPDDGSAE